MNRYACKNEEAIYLREENRGNTFFDDAKRIVFSKSYQRCQGKTQVYSQVTNDHVADRMIHVQLVSRTAREIARGLGLNEDLVEAGALGHDNGHTPFGHDGEKSLNKLSLAHGEGYFNHNVQGVRNLMFLENHGEGLNISVQVMDAILCHNGEVTEHRYEPRIKSVREFLDEYYRCYQNKGLLKELHPMTLEGSVIRVSDVISYLGQDVDDAKRMGLFDWDRIPSDIKRTLGASRDEIADTCIRDILANSRGKNYIQFSTPVFLMVDKMLKFNTANIYIPKMNEEEYQALDQKFKFLYDCYLEYLIREDRSSSIGQYYDNMSDTYIKNNRLERVVLDYMAGMTDNFFMMEYDKEFTRARKK